MKGHSTAAIAMLMALAAGGEPIIPALPMREPDKRTPDEDAERMAAAEAKRQRKAAKRRATMKPTNTPGGECE